jgi:hypothetical protein
MPEVDTIWRGRDNNCVRNGGDARVKGLDDAMTELRCNDLETVLERAAAD